MLINTIFNLQAVFFGHVMRKKKQTFLRTGLIFKEKAAGERSERRCRMD